MKPTLRLAVAAVVTTAAAVGLASPALAHVHVDGTDATQGGYGVLTFRVPTESDTASTTDLIVTLPDDQPIVSVTPQIKPGWTANVVKKKLPTPQKDDDGNEVTDYVSTVEWKADNPQTAIPPNLFDTFSISVGPLPKEDSLALPASQIYSDGKVVNWNEKTVAGQPEPDHPAPVVELVAAVPDTGAAAESASVQAAGTPAASTPAWPGITALALAVIAVLLGIANLALLRRRS